MLDGMDAYRLFRIKPGTRVRLSQIDPGDTREFPHREAAAEQLRANTERSLALQLRLWAEGRRSLLIVLQGMDTSGKDGTIRHVMSGLDPTGVKVHSFKKPSEEELSRDFLWRIHQRTPRRGEITVFNRSHYEDILITRVHRLIDDETAARRTRAILDFERLLTENGTTIIKFFLHISKDEQRRRLQERLDDPEKNWKFTPSDVAERRRWKDYQRVFEQAISRTSTRHAPWFVIPADAKWFRNLAVSQIIVRTLERMDPKIPPPRCDLSSIVIK